MPAEPEARRQLSALARVAAALDEAGIAYWLFGGWAVDVYVGAVTRRHDDLDLAVWLAEAPRIGELLRRDGWRHVPSPDEDGGTAYERDGVRLELTFLARDGDGRVVTPLRGGPGVWPDGAFADDAGSLDVARSRLISLDALLRSKSPPRADPEDAAKDRTDFGRLSVLGKAEGPR